LTEGHVATSDATVEQIKDEDSPYEDVIARTSLCRPVRP
jgi:hypothetical protein